MSAAAPELREPGTELTYDEGREIRAAAEGTRRPNATIAEVAEDVHDRVADVDHAGAYFDGQEAALARRREDDQEDEEVID
jgi:hypothetical protein